MPVCPKCRAEYRAEARTCADCDVDLVEPAPPAAATGGDDWVALASFPTEVEAAPLIARLDSEDIRHEMENQGVSAVHPLLGMAIGGVIVKVPKSDGPRALDMVRRGSGPACPQCRSRDTMREKFSCLEVAVSVLFLGLPLLFIPVRRRCRMCGHRWSVGH
ncbi:MAG: hypothetical protein HYY17_14595 [Planctomycetes bacterium]|nr:hypothetical protein [Planctomycetota bacterium]